MGYCFLCDTGYILGCANSSDPYFDSADEHYNKYPYTKYAYYYCWKVRKECQRKCESPEYIRDKDKRELLEYIDEYLSEIDEINKLHGHELYNTLFNRIIDLIYNPGDSEILSHYIIWHYSSGHEHHCMITTDRKDIYSNKKKINDIANLLFSECNGLCKIQYKLLKRNN